MDDKELQKCQFKVYRLKQINDDQKQAIDDLQAELKQLKQDFAYAQSKLNKIIDIATLEIK